MATKVKKINGWMIVGWLTLFMLLLLLLLLGSGFIVWNLVTADSSGEGISYLTYAISGTTLLLVGLIAPLKEIKKWIPAVVTTIGVVVLVFGLYGLYTDWKNEKEEKDRTANHSYSRPDQITSPKDVQLVNCSQGWSNEIPVPTNLRFTWSQDVDAQYRSGGKWHDVTMENIPDIVSKLRFCTRYADEDGTNIHVTWTRR